MPTYRILYTQSEYREAVVDAASEFQAREILYKGINDYDVGNDTEDFPVLVDIWEV